MNKQLLNQLQKVENLNSQIIIEAIQDSETKIANLKQKVELLVIDQMSLEDMAAKWLLKGDYDKAPRLHAPMSEEQKRKISEKMKGRTLSEETKERMRENSRRMTVYQYTLDGELVHVWKSTREVMRVLGWNSTSISLCCLGKQKTSHGFLWRYSPIDTENPMVRMTITSEWENKGEPQLP